MKSRTLIKNLQDILTTQKNRSKNAVIARVGCGWVRRVRRCFRQFRCKRNFRRWIVESYTRGDCLQRRWQFSTQTFWFYSRRFQIQVWPFSGLQNFIHKLIHESSPKSSVRKKPALNRRLRKVKIFTIRGGCLQPLGSVSILLSNV